MRDLEPGEFFIDDEDEVLRRQVAPAVFDEGKPMKAAFDDDQTLWMSTHRGRVDPKESYRRWVAMGNSSVGTYGIRVGDAKDLNAPSVDDSERLNIPDHASVVLEDLTRNARKRVSRKLRDRAQERGPLFTPEP